MRQISARVVVDIAKPGAALVSLLWLMTAVCRGLVAPSRIREKDQLLPVHPHTELALVEAGLRTTGETALSDAILCV